MNPEPDILTFRLGEKASAPDTGFVMTESDEFALQELAVTLDCLGALMDHNHNHDVQPDQFAALFRTLGRATRSIAEPTHKAHIIAVKH